MLRLINRAAKGERGFRFPLTLFIFIFLTARPWARRGSRFIQTLFIDRVAMGRARFYDSHTCLRKAKWKSSTNISIRLTSTYGSL